MAKKLEQLNEVSNAILEMLKSKPEVKSKSDCFPNTHSGLYSQSNMISYLEKKYTSLKVVQALNDLQICKEIGLYSINVKNLYFNETYPYYYFVEFTTNIDAIKIANEYVAWSKEQAKEITQRRKEERSKSVSKKRKVSQKQIDALARARQAKKDKANA
jgi:hypothetical protein